jgi:hypothetical protein
MNLKLFSILMIGCLMISSNSHAKTFRQSIGTGNSSLDLSYENYKIDNELKSTTTGVTPAFYNGIRKSPVERDVLILRGSYGLFDKLDVFAGIGYTYEKWTSEERSTGVEKEKQTGQDPIFELGIKGTVFEFYEDKAYLSYLFKYSYLKSGDKYTGVPPNPTNSESIWNEYNVDLELGYRSDFYELTPYVGLSYMDLEVKQKLDGDFSKYENEDEFSLFLGLNKEVNEDISLNIEGAIGAKEGISLGLNYSF